jgi:hypothetical protein
MVTSNVDSRWTLEFWSSERLSLKHKAHVVPLGKPLEIDDLT